jgi:predicted membrane protein
LPFTEKVLSKADHAHIFASINTSKNKPKNNSKMENSNTPKRGNGHLIAGFVVLLVGFLFLLKNFNILSPELNYYIFSWKTLLIGIGVLNLVFTRNNVAGIILIAIGTFFWLPDWFDLSFRIAQVFWPIVIILVGLAILFKGTGDRRSGKRWWRNQDNYTNETSLDKNKASDGSDSYYNTGNPEQEFIDEVAIFSGSEKKLNTLNFRGGRLTAIFGAIQLDLIKSRLAKGENILNIFCMFGGSEIKVPAEWNVVMKAVPVFGAVSDERPTNYGNENDESDRPVLIIKGLAIFGGVEIKS